MKRTSNSLSMPLAGTALALAVTFAGPGCGDDNSSTDTDGTTTDATTTGDDEGSEDTDPGTQNTDEGPAGESSSDSAADTSGDESDTTGIAPTCGDGILDADEECDDGNTDNTDECSAQCQISVETAWTASYDGPAGSGDVFSQLTTDDAGNIYALGRHETETEQDVLIKQYDPEGNEGWTFSWNSENNLDDRGVDFAWHPGGDLIVVGSSTSEDTGGDILMMRVATDTREVTWFNTIDGAGSGEEDVDSNDFGSALAVDGDGNIIAAGSERIDDQRYDLWVGKYDADGQELWTRRYGGKAARNEFADSVAIAADGSAYVLGSEDTSAVARETFVRIYSPEGDLLGVHTQSDVYDDLALAPDGAMILAGSISASASSSDIAVSRFVPTADPKALEYQLDWSYTAPGPSGGFDYANALTLDANGDVYVAGVQLVTNEQQNIWVGKIDLTGQPVWATAYNNDKAGLGDFGNAVAVDGDGNVFAAGSETVIGQRDNGWLRKYTQR